MIGISPLPVLMTLDEEKAAKGPDPDEEETPQNAGLSFDSSAFSLSSQLLSNLDRKGLKLPTQVQLQVIPKIRNERGGDLCVNAPTGSGKTLAYAVPITEVLIFWSPVLSVEVVESIVHRAGMCGDCADEGISSTSSRGIWYVRQEDKFEGTESLTTCRL